MFGQDPPSLNISGHVPVLPHLSNKACLEMTSFGNVLLLFIAMTHAGCGLKLCRVTTNRDDKLFSPLSETQVDGEVKLKMY